MDVDARVRFLRLIPHQLNINSIPILSVCLLAVDGPLLLHAHAGLSRRRRRDTPRVGHRDGFHVHERLAVLIGIPAQRPSAYAALDDIVVFFFFQLVALAVCLEVTLPAVVGGQGDRVDQRAAGGCAFCNALIQINRQAAGNEIS